jgi:DNA-directed RNA polymerase subunit K/omega
MLKKNTKKKVNKEESDDENLEINDDIIEENDDIIEEDDILEENDDFEEEDYNEVTELEETETFADCILDKVIEDEIYDIDNNDDSEIEEINSENKILKGKDRISANRLTKYEMVRILGERTKQLTMGSKPLIKNYEGLNYDKIAEEELKLNMIPYKIKRPLPNGKYEFWSLDELFKDHLLTLLE